MAGRSQIQNPIDTIVGIARREIAPPYAPDMTSAANYTPRARGRSDDLASGAMGTDAPISSTRAGTDSDGNAITLYDFMTELDSTNSINALTGSTL